MNERHYSDRAAVAANQNIEEKAFWLSVFSPEPVKSRFYADYSESREYREEDGENRAMKVETSRFSGGLAAKVIKLSGGIDLKLHMILAAGLTALLEKYTGTGDIVFGSPIIKQETEADFINTILVFRTRVERTETFRELLVKVRETIISATENQNYPLEVLPDILGIPVTAGEFSLFDVALLLENIHEISYLKGIDYNMLFSFKREEDRIEFSLEYNSLLYREQTVKQIVRFYTRLLETALSDVNIPLDHIDILDEADRRRQLEEFNAKETGNPGDRTFHGLFEDQAAKTPGNIAVIGEREITYNELNEGANRLARFLREKGVGPETITALMVEPSEVMIIAVLGILKAGGAYLPLDTGYPEERIRFILSESGTRLLVTRGHLREKVRFDGTLIDVIDLEDEAIARMQSTNPVHVNSPSDPVYVIYTSGSTGRPKGVMVEHRSVIHYLFAFGREFDITPADTVLQQASYCFDVFVEEVYPVLSVGGKIAVPSRDTVRDIDLLCNFISRNNVTIVDCSPLLLNELNNPDALPYLESVRLFISGGDVLKGVYIDNLIKTRTVYNTYGPTETTVCAAYHKCAAGVKSAVPIGKPITNYTVHILDKKGKLLPIGVPGELCIGGDGVARGYLNNPELTAERFYRSYKSYRTYKTGDLARWLPDGVIQFLGRSDYQVKVRGYRIELGEIEGKLLEHPDVREAVVAELTDANAEKYLCGYVVSSKDIEPGELRDFLGKKLPDYMIPWFYVRLDRLPLTPNGKIDRKALPEPVLSGEAAYVPPGNKTEEKLVELWAQVLSKSQDEIGIDTNFFDLGGNSLKAIVLTTRLHKELNVKLKMSDIFTLQTIREISALITKTAEEKFVPIEPVETKEYYVPASPQRRYYILQQLDPENTSFNISSAVLCEGKTDMEKFGDTFKKLVKRHEIFRTSFLQVGGELVQRVHPEIPFEIEMLPVPGAGAGGGSTDEIIETFIRPFDLSRAPLLRVGMARLEEDRHLLVIDVHHIVSDGLSQQLLILEFLGLYRGMEPAPPLKIQYKDFSEWQNSERGKEELKIQEEYWLSILNEDVPLLNLPVDYPRGKVQSFEGDSVGFEIDPGDTLALKKMAADRGVTLYIIFLALCNIWLSKICAQETVVIGSGVGGRKNPDLQNMAGSLQNMMVLINQPAGDLTFAEFLAGVEKRTLEAFENQDYPFDELVTKASVPREKGRNPLFDFFYILNNSELPSVNDPRYQTPGLTFTSYPYSRGDKTGRVRFDLALYGNYNGETVTFFMEYGTTLFKSETIEQFVQSFKEILEAVLENEDICLNDIIVSSGLGIGKDRFEPADYLEFAF